jgi:hypothetical protein
LSAEIIMERCISSGRLAGSSSSPWRKWRSIGPCAPEADSEPDLLMIVADQQRPFTAIGSEYGLQTRIAGQQVVQARRGNELLL